MNQLNTAKRSQITAALIEGNSINATCRMLGVGKHTVLRLLEDAGCACAAFHDANVRGLRVGRAQCDEIWSFVYAKEKNVTLEQRTRRVADCWTWTAIDADSKLIISYMLGDRGASTAQAFMQDVASRISNRIQLTTDGHRVYAEAVEDAFGSEIDYAMLVKIYGSSNDNPESRYSPATCIGCRTGVLSGTPDPKYISTSYVERQNLSMRMGMRRFTRLTNGFSKKFENHGAPSCALLHALQFLPRAFIVARDPGYGSGPNRSRLDAGRIVRPIAREKPNARADKAMVLKALEEPLEGLWQKRIRFIFRILTRACNMWALAAYGH